MNSVRKIALSFVVMIILHGAMFSQAEVAPRLQFPDFPKFYFDALSFSSDQKNMSRLDVYVEVPYNVIHFTNQGDLFTGSYEITVDIRDTLENILSEKTWDEKIEAKKYEETSSPKTSNLSQKSFLQLPGRYIISVQLTDHETKKVSSIKRNLIVRDFSQSTLSLSDLMLVNRITIENGKKIVSPNISGNVGALEDGFFVLFETYQSAPVDSALTFVRIYNARHTIVQQDSFYQQLGAEKRASFRKVNTTKLIAGEYAVGVEMYPHAGEVAFSTRSFSIHWKGLPSAIGDLDLAINQMQYIADKDKLDEIRDAEKDKKKELFENFWKKKDPTPNTDRNELMEEYYARVAYANKNFGHYMEGWRTDMGMVYIIFGPPSNVERHPFDLDSKPYEIWLYDEQNRQFVFIDASGFGDYRLQTPIWDVWRTRQR